jgi:hypothetical protein
LAPSRHRRLFPGHHKPCQIIDLPVDVQRFQADSMLDSYHDQDTPAPESWRSVQSLPIASEPMAMAAAWLPR